MRQQVTAKNNDYAEEEEEMCYLLQSYKPPSALETSFHSC